MIIQRIIGFLVVLCIYSGTVWSQAYRIEEEKPKLKKKEIPVKEGPVNSLPSFEQSPQQKNDPQIRNIKVISEMSDGKGNIVRTIQYDKGAFRITETLIKPKVVGIGDNSRRVNPDTMDKKQVLLVIDKSKYVLDVLYKKRHIRSYRATFGPLPKQNKCMEGDRCTPEGTFTITNLNPKSMYNKFMLLSYPDETSWARFKELKKQGKIPSSAKIGGAIGIHGIWKGGDQLIDLGVGWTDGCVALKNKDVDELYSMVGIGTKVTIRY